MLTETTQILIAPGRSKAAKHTRGRSNVSCIPSYAKAVAVERFYPFFGFKALQDQRILRAIQQIRQENLRPFVAEKSTHSWACLLYEGQLCNPQHAFETRPNIQSSRNNIAAL